MFSVAFAQAALVEATDAPRCRAHRESTLQTPVCLWGVGFGKQTIHYRACCQALICEWRLLEILKSVCLWAHWHKGLFFPWTWHLLVILLPFIHSVMCWMSLRWALYKDLRIKQGTTPALLIPLQLWETRDMSVFTKMQTCNYDKFPKQRI